MSTAVTPLSELHSWILIYFGPSNPIQSCAVTTSGSYKVTCDGSHVR